ncbi:MAG: hypothetical protein QNJ85_12125 [Gammaproteobacteria bacterium]|nr:hypothetical protein [Gammaproteobacteria bacterium]
MTSLLYAAALMAVAIGLAHSLLGERYILQRLFRRGGLPPLFGGTGFTRNTLRFAWHLTTLAWWGFAAVLVALAQPTLERSILGNIVGIVFLLHALVALAGSRGKHFSWLVFLAIGTCTLLTVRM